MKLLNEKIAYLKGLTEGYGFSEEDRVQNVLTEVITILQEMAYEIENLQEAHNELETYVEEIDEDLDLLEEVYYSELEDLDDMHYDCHCHRDEDDDDDLYEVVCPACHEVYLADFEDFEANDVQCPHCGEDFKLEESVVEQLDGTKE